MTAHASVSRSSAKVALVRDPGEGEAVLALPPWIGPAPSTRRRSTYWHQPRSARIWTPDWDPGRRRLHVHLWCGQGRSRNLEPTGPADVPDWTFAFDAPADLKCGTCEGRRAGHVRDDGLVFAPRDQFALPTWCPGDGTDEWPSYCVACGHKLRAAHGWNSYGFAAHRPVPDVFLARCRPCPRHGWTRAWSRDGRVSCGMHGCGFDCGPFAAAD